MSVVVLTGCGKKAPPPPPPPPPPPVAPPPPEPANLGNVARAVNADPKVQFPQDRAPVDESLARAVFQFAGAFARGDSGALDSMLEAASRPTLSSLTADRRWETATAELEAVRVVSLVESLESDTQASNAQLVLAFQEPGSSYVLAWRASRAGSAWVFAAAPSTADVKTRASDWDNLSSYAPAAVVSTAPAAPAPEGASPGAPPPENAPSAAPAAPGDAPLRKNTPGGPVTIPQPGGSGG
ncbi:MAG: hypothetical protein SFZ23_07780 [Planctomycetota bacterium]|nr:hypothetical protein [Planctomycetota bacterium]